MATTWKFCLKYETILLRLHNIKALKRLSNLSFVVLYAMIYIHIHRINNKHTWIQYKYIFTFYESRYLNCYRLTRHISKQLSFYYYYCYCVVPTLHYTYSCLFIYKTSTFHASWHSVQYFHLFALFILFIYLLILIFVQRIYIRNTKRVHGTDIVVPTIQRTW